MHHRAKQLAKSCAEVVSGPAGELPIHPQVRGSGLGCRQPIDGRMLLVGGDGA